MVRQNDSNTAFPGWFRNIIWFAGIVVAVVIYHNATFGELHSRVSVLESELTELKKKYSEDVREILHNTAEIKAKLNATDEHQ